jgi:hypothetical protein
MFAFYAPIFLLQAFCVYHAYRNNVEQRWYWLILFFPLVGCVIYLVQNFSTRTSLEQIAENVKEVVNSSYKIEQLEKALKFSESVTNKLNLADAYMEVARYKDAVALYSSSLEGFMAGDTAVMMKLCHAHFMDDNFAAAVEHGTKLENLKPFRNSEERVVYAWALHHLGNTDKAEAIFLDMDRSFTNYYHRMEYSKFLIKTGKTDLAKEKLRDLVDEFEQMNGPERRLKKNTYREIKDLYTNLVGA